MFDPPGSAQPIFRPVLPNVRQALRCSTYRDPHLRAA